MKEKETMADKYNDQKKADRKDILKYMAQFLNIERQFPLLPGTKDVGIVAKFIGIEPQELIDIRSYFDDQAKKAAMEMLKDETTIEQIQQLPFKKNDKIVVLGDSMTDDLQSWFEILVHMLEIALPDLDLSFVNASLGGDTSYDALKRFDRDVIAQNPDWVIFSLGTHDAERPNYAANRTVVSLTEFWENLNTLDLAVKDITKNPAIWITPPPVIEEMMDESPEFNTIIQEKDLIQYRDVISGKSGYIVDPLGNRMGRPPEAWNYLNDGLHPSLAGHVQTVKALMKALTNVGEEEHDHDDHHHHHGHHDHDHDDED